MEGQNNEEKTIRNNDGNRSFRKLYHTGSRSRIQGERARARAELCRCKRRRDL